MPRSARRLALIALVTLTAAGTAAAQVRPNRMIPGGGVRPKSEVVTLPEFSDPDKALAAAKLAAADPDGLREYLRLRTLTEADLARIEEVIGRFGADDFEVRQKASADAEKLGPAAVGPLRKAAAVESGNPKAIDYEVAYRAEAALKRLDVVPHAAVALAAVKVLGRTTHPDTIPTLLKFLPVSDTPAVADAIRAVLAAHAVRDGAADPALVAGLTDPKPVVRAAAAVALVSGGPAPKSGRVRIPDALPAVAKAAAAEADIDTQFQMLFTLVTTTGDPAAVGHLIDTLARLPRGRLWQAEDYLLQLAGPAAPPAVFGRTPESLTKAQAAWAGWWAANRAAAKADVFVYTPRVLGRVLLVLTSNRNAGIGEAGVVCELGPDLKEQWRISNLASPFDACVKPDGTVVVAESAQNQITTRTTQGQVVAVRKLGVGLNGNTVIGPQQVQLLPDDGLLVTCRNAVVELRKDTQTVICDRSATYDVTSAVRLPSGETAVVLQNNAPNQLMFYDKAGKPVDGKKVKVGMPFYQAHVAAAGPDRLLITEQAEVVEYGLTDGQAKWRHPAQNIRCVQRLPNGNTLLVDADRRRVVEVTPANEEVWEYTPPGDLGLFRAYRR